ncbi:MAG TPA: tRNA uridine(34) 5-carboxymethylaminomethyl modification radical SAM/GNAT enzyme Elp3 [Spirochaetia bacterium]|nr:tRNA uridine(34) 5-carboxymethylaminomethyl modification radical SAM/GNAT enzyme Elp3 [Spirochaetia bacterium]
MTIDELVVRDNEKLTLENIEDYRRIWSKELKRMPKNSEIWPYLTDPELIEAMKTRGVRTESGVAPFAVMMKPFYCPGNCVYCPLEEGMPKSYLSDEPAAQRAKLLNFDSYKQVEGRIRQMQETGHITDKIDLIVIGGTFGSYPEEYKREFFKSMFDAVNGVVSKSLAEAHAYNETAEKRIVGISIETRPDWVTEEEIKLWRELGVTKIQLGVQAFNEEILRKIRRDHGLKEIAEATRMCRNAGIKICYHLMPNLPGSNPNKDMEMARLMFEDKRFGPDYLKVYPAMTIAGTEMYEMWKQGEYVPYGEEELIKVLKEIKAQTPVWCRIDRLIRDISKKWVSAGNARTNLRQVLQEELKKEGKKCRCVRCREVRGGVYDTKVKLLVNERESLGGKELFLSYESEDHLFSMLRLRLPEQSEKMLFDELVGVAIVREVHTYGQVAEIDTYDGVKTQHRGLGKRLMIKAEEIAKERGYVKMAVISAIGTREYYRKLGYELEGSYMVKSL